MTVGVSMSPFRAIKCWSCPGMKYPATFAGLPLYNGLNGVNEPSSLNTTTVVPMVDCRPAVGRSIAKAARHCSRSLAIRRMRDSLAFPINRKCGDRTVIHLSAADADVAPPSVAANAAAVITPDARCFIAGPPFEKCRGYESPPRDRFDVEEALGACYTRTGVFESLNIPFDRCQRVGEILADVLEVGDELLLGRGGMGAKSAAARAM